MHKLTHVGDGEFRTNYTKGLNPILLPEKDVIDCTSFAYDMTFGKVGEHRRNMSGLSYQRSDSEIFANVFQGKAGEFAVKNYLLSLGLDVSDVDLSIYKKGKWDNGDLYLGDDLISVKSSPSYVNFLRLNYYDYDEHGKYKYGRSMDDYIMYTRVLPNINKKMRNASFKIDEMIRQDSLTASDIERLILLDEWQVDVTGFITHGDFAEEIIANDYVVLKGEKVDGLNMFTDSFYAQSGDLRNLESLVNDDFEIEF